MPNRTGPLWGSRGSLRGVTVLERLRAVLSWAAAPACLDGTRAHVAGEQDPDGGVWCAVCDQLVPMSHVREI